MRETISQDDLVILGELERKVLRLASWTIHQANHLRENTDGLKVGGHQASSASLATIMTALYFRILRPHDRVAVKPHASPNFHAIQYLLGKARAGPYQRQTNDILLECGCNRRPIRGRGRSRLSQSASEGFGDRDSHRLASPGYPRLEGFD